ETAPATALALIANRALPANRIDVLHLNYAHVAVALEPHSLAGLRDLERWLPQRGAALAADTAVLVAGDEDAYRQAISVARRLYEGVLDVVLISKTPEGQVRGRSAVAEGLLASRAGRATGRAVPAAGRVFEPAPREPGERAVRPAAPLRAGAAEEAAV